MNKKNRKSGMDSGAVASPFTSATDGPPTTLKTNTNLFETRTITMKKLLGTLLALPMLLSVGEARAAENFGEFKVRINATNAEKWKVRWLCNEADGSTSTIDGDTYPASKKTTRTTNITAAKCSTGDWKVEFQIKSFGSWLGVKPGGSACAGDGNCGFTTDGGWSYKTYARPSNFNASNKLCLVGYNFSYTSVYLTKEGC